ncbi:HAD-IA family hydrolase [Solirubrobacter sp. CPCC 204708]|uniref:HAD-IA family hydrolase n=1 Tax=Solirubrobacter deserti TaxID=2282478 RepID=A0ABT4RPX9_9ACTN|nr:HAD-IA family hydrolase [Solirubrobacter deserti]MBE2318244.1 HAD-IA family hydrolase [Solirubrobacter deserti]MDA0140582.1 HAD-IA family hydrolase [Solirubrobacter deserti]
MREVVIFDLDGVLVESAPVVEASWRRWAGERNVDWGALRPVLHGRPGRELVAEFAPALDVEAEVATITAYEMAEEGALRAIPGARECIEAAPRWAIATSGGRELALGRLRAVGHPIPEVLISADDITRGKPDPEPYLKAAAAMNAESDTCLVIEDAPAGIAAARAAGMRVVAVTTSHAPEDLSAADAVYGSMDEVRRAELGTRAPAPRSP